MATKERNKLGGLLDMLEDIKEIAWDLCPLVGSYSKQKF